MERFLLLALAAMTMGAACTTTSDAASLVVADDSGVVVVDESGEERRRLASVDAGVFAFQPTWSPDGEHVVYAEATDAAHGDLVIAGIDGGEVRLERATRPYYFSWDPAGDRVVTLRNLESAEGGIIVESVALDGTTEEIDRGAPYYFDWDPAGGRYLLHVELDRIELFTPGDGSESLGTAGLFQAPSWDETARVYIGVEDGVQSLLVDEGDGPRPLAGVPGVAQMVAAGGRVAIQVFGGGDGGDGQAAAFRQLPELEPGALFVVDTDGMDRVIDEPAAAFFWSPDGSRLLILSVAQAPGEVQWSVWDGEETTTYPAFGVEPSWVQSFLPFFDQYATSMSLWAPDGASFAYPGVVAGERGIWVQRLTEQEPTRIADGYWVAWRPQR